MRRLMQLLVFLKTVFKKYSLYKKFKFHFQIAGYIIQLVLSAIFCKKRLLVLLNFFIAMSLYEPMCGVGDVVFGKHKSLFKLILAP